MIQLLDFPEKIEFKDVKTGEVFYLTPAEARKRGFTSVCSCLKCLHKRTKK